MAELQERKPKAPRAKLSDCERQQGPQQQHVWSNVGRTLRVTGTDARMVQVAAWQRLLVKPGVVSQLDHAEAKATWTE